jgi:hypothetical protein
MKAQQADHSKDRFSAMHRAVDAGGQQQMPDEGSFALIQEQSTDWHRAEREAEQAAYDRAENEKRQGRLF